MSDKLRLITGCHCIYYVHKPVPQPDSHVSCTVEIFYFFVSVNDRRRANEVKAERERKSECEDIMEAVELEMRTSEPTGGIEGHQCHLLLSVIV